MNIDQVKEILSVLKPQTGYDEGLVLYEAAEKISPKTIVEIGIADGGSLKLWSNLLDTDGLLIGIDAYNYLAWDITKTKCKTVFILGNTFDQSTYNNVVKELCGREIDFMRIDGGHSYDAVCNDYVKYSSLVRKGGMIAFHDYKSSVEVKKFIDEIRIGKQYYFPVDGISDSVYTYKE